MPEIGLFFCAWCDHAPLIFAPLSSPPLAPCWVGAVYSGKKKYANLFHTAVTSHHDIVATLLQGSSALAVKVSDMLFSSEGNPIWVTLPPLPQLRRLFAQGHVSFEYQRLWGGGQTLNDILGGFSQGMRLPKCPRRRNLLSATKQSLWCRSDCNLSASWKKWTQMSICIPMLHGFDGTWEIALSFARETRAATMNTFLTLIFFNHAAQKPKYAKCI